MYLPACRHGSGRALSKAKSQKIKFWKRLMFGRANLGLLRKTALWN